MILWELVNRPYRIPFKGLAPVPLMKAKLARGENQETLPEKCPPKYAELIRWCWQTPQKRPSAKQVAEGLRPLWEETSKTPAPEYYKNRFNFLWKMLRESGRKGGFRIF